MAKKQQRATDLLNIELTRIHAALAIIAQTASDLPDSKTKSGLMSLLAEAKRGRASAYEHLQTISLHASMI